MEITANETGFNEEGSRKGKVTVLEFKCKMMAWLSRPITKSLSDYKARIVLQRFNELLGTNFSRADMELIYDRLGNGVAKTLCIEFIESNYDLSLLKR
ncbi:MULTISPECIES: hypothetical protein [Bacillus cereus group]|uniref:hypothetical protein n=1 Tax=Bacillus cereus group TaxID=86661 RepID=UPI0022E768E7|nr:MULTISPECIES: hypothetical protein [unclassified Bacillus cereus group]MDA2667227.1 hypothetical protein [Bacillus cereus group sp. Bc032]MDA2677927.1 hypothetical protein [Bacillus cereus group sp. Bc031]MDA2683434.1 hypothetical protein [Bacillus cereus group sp. Bc029]MDA2688866.1 hypothetical protein [Bacillus cereus group sp. Bc030]MDA2744405.1 hypothetical protein [Bacillus cereus group sp. Bc011]